MRPSNLKHKHADALQYLIVGLLALSVAACGPLISFGGDEKPGEIYGLRYPAPYAASSPVGPIVYIDSPQMVEALGGQNIAVVMPDGQRTSLDGVTWATNLSDILRDYIGHSLSATEANIISEGGLDIKAGCRLGLKVWSFEFAPGISAEDDKVKIAIQFSLVRLSDSVLLSHPTFSQEIAVKNATASGVVGSFRAGMEAAAKDYGVWFQERMNQCQFKG